VYIIYIYVTQQKGAGSRHVENGGANVIGHLRALSPRIYGWMKQAYKIIGLYVK